MNPRLKVLAQMYGRGQERSHRECLQPSVEQGGDAVTAANSVGDLLRVYFMLMLKVRYRKHCVL